MGGGGDGVSANAVGPCIFNTRPDEILQGGPRAVRGKIYCSIGRKAYVVPLQVRDCVWGRSSHLQAKPRCVGPCIE